jgi:hypothetical protein
LHHQLGATQLEPQALPAQSVAVLPGTQAQRTLVGSAQVLLFGQWPTPQGTTKLERPQKGGTQEPAEHAEPTEQRHASSQRPGVQARHHQFGAEHWPVQGCFEQS